MRLKLHAVAALLFLLPFASQSQQLDSLSHKLDSLKKQADTAGQVNLTAPSFYNEKTKMTGKVFGHLLLDDFWQQFRSPIDIRGKRGIWTSTALLGATAALGFFGDLPIQHGAVRLRKQNPWIGNTAHFISNWSGVYEAGYFIFFLGGGALAKNQKFRTTTGLAMQAYITSTVWSTLFKYVSGRLRPNPADLTSETFQSSPRFHGPGYAFPYGGNSAFPSGHTTLAFAAARVYAMEYKHTVWAPVSYGLATVISASRVFDNKHWASDIFAGFVLGYACGTQVVNNYHRYARLVRTGEINNKKKKKKGDLSFNLQYLPGGGLEPGLVYQFR